MLSSMGVLSTRHRVTFIFTIGIQNLVRTISGPFRSTLLISNEGLHALEQGVSLGATHDSAKRYPSPNCHPDTRKAVRQIIIDWIHSESSTSSFFWLYGPAGAGKTAILQAIVEFLCSPSGSGQNFGGSFFFSSGKNDEGHFLFSTIAYQLALKVPGLRQEVNRIMDRNPTLHTKTMDVQLQALIVEAFKCLSPLPQYSYLVIIDGLDECQGKKTQQSILQLLCETIIVHKLPLRFLIGSRPESHIRDIFDQESLRTVTQRVVLDESLIPEEILRCFCKMALRRCVPRIPACLTWNNHGPGKGLLIFLSNDHRANSSMPRPSSNLLVPISAVQWSSLRLY